MPIDHVVGEDLRAGNVAARREVLKCADAHMARSHPRQDGAGLRRFPLHGLAGADRRERPRRRNPQGVHRFADQIFAQDRTQGGPPVAAARERRAAAAFQLDIAQHTRAVAHLADQNRPAIAQLRNKMTELMTCVGHGDGNNVLGQNVAGKKLRRGRRIESG